MLLDRKTLWVIAALVAWLVPGQAFATSVVTNNDTTVRGGANADTNYGFATDLEVNGTDGGGGEDADASAKVWLRFDVGDFTTETSYVLKLRNGTPTGNTIDVFGLIDPPGDDVWPEGALTWNNADSGGHGNNADRAVDLVAAELSGGGPICSFSHTGSVSSCSSTSLDSYILGELGENGGNDDITLILAAQLGDGASFFHSSENTSGQLATIESVPEPGTLLLLGSGIAGLAILGRSRG